MIYYAVIDTNVFISALLSKNSDTATVKVLNAMLDGIIVPLCHSEILAEYDEVLHREKFHFHENSIQKILSAPPVKQYGVNVVPQATEEMFVDKDDLIFYEIALAKVDEGAYLITGNQKHYPLRSFIVTPTEMMRIIEQ